jgi:NIPSNAP
VLYRMRIYQTVRENLPVFHEFFRTYLLPVQLRHGARLVGRWETEDGRVVAIWEYNDAAAYEQIQAAVRADPDSEVAREHRANLPSLITATEEVFMSSTVHAAS